MISRTFKLCLNAGSGSAPYINVNQYDEGETWLFELYSENGERYIPSSGAIVGVKSDGHGIVNTGTVDSEGRVVITETQQMTASAGRAIYELSIDGLTHGTANFIVAVERKPTDEAVMSDSDLSLIQEAIDSAEVIVEVIGDSDPSEVIGEHVDDWLDNHPEATTTVQDGAITAPKINNSLWDKLLVSEEASGNPASFDDGADDVPVSSLKVALEPVQLGSGDPSPSNVRPIIAANGKNLLNDSIKTQTSASNNVFFAGAINNTDTEHAFTLKAGTYTYSCVLNDGTTTNLYLRNPVAGTYISGFPIYNVNRETFTLTEDTPVVAWTYKTNLLVENVKYAMIERGSSASPYQPYQGIAVNVTGKNLLDITNHVEIHSVTFTGSPQDFTLTATGAYCYYQIQIPCKANQPITVRLEGSSTGDFKGVYISHLNMYTNSYKVWTLTDSLVQYTYTFTPTEDAFNMKFYVTATGTTGDMHIKNLQAEYGSEATEYEPFIGNSYPYTLGQSVYGGTVDLATGVLTITHFSVALKDVTWAKGTATEYSFTGTGSVLSRMPSRASATLASQMLSSNYPLTNSAAISGYETALAPATYDRKLYLRDIRYTTVADLVSALTSENAVVVIPLTTPTTVQLTPTQVKTLLGYNNISSTGTVDVIYHADTKLYVDKMTAVDNNIIAPTEADFVATRNYTVNDLVIVNDTLYKVTSNIQNGGTITPNSNVQQTTLGALIKALS